MPRAPLALSLAALGLLVAGCSSSGPSRPGGCTAYDAARADAIAAVMANDSGKADTSTTLTRLKAAAQAIQDAAQTASPALSTQLKQAASDLATSVDAQGKGDARRTLQFLQAYTADLPAIDAACGFTRPATSPGAG